MSVWAIDLSGRHHLSMSEDILTEVRRCCWHLVDRGQGCCSTSCQRNAWSKLSIVPLLKDPVWNRYWLEGKRCHYSWGHPTNCIRSSCPWSGTSIPPAFSRHVIVQSCAKCSGSAHFPRNPCALLVAPGVTDYSLCDSTQALLKGKLLYFKKVFFFKLLHIRITWELPKLLI